MNSYYEEVPVEQELPEKAAFYFTITKMDAYNECANREWFDPIARAFEKEPAPTFWLRPVSSLPEDAVKEIAVKFFRHWWNSSGNNTEQGFDDWWKVNRDTFLSKP